MTLILSVLCVFLFVFHGVEGNVSEKVMKESDDVSITCDNPGTIFWLRLKENGQGFEYTATYSKSKNTGKVISESKFKVTENSLQVKSFKQQEDSGTYSCVSINNNELKFSGITKLRGEPVPTPTTIQPKVQTIQPQTFATMKKPEMTCTPNAEGKTSTSIDVVLGCQLHIFLSLAAGCGLLLLLLVVTILYCNRIRTRRCPHHYKRQTRSRQAGHKTLPNPPDY